MAKKTLDLFDGIIERMNWKIGNFAMRPILFGVAMALLDIVMMGTIKLVHTGGVSGSIGIPMSVGVYALQPLVFLKAMKFESMTVVNLIWNMMSNIIVTLQGVFIFGESIKGIRWLGISMSLVSLAILAYSND
jgi:multidrug transporter EmrE-like cation transporter